VKRRKNPKLLLPGIDLTGKEKRRELDSDGLEYGLVTSFCEQCEFLGSAKTGYFLNCFLDYSTTLFNCKDYLELHGRMGQHDELKGCGRTLP